MKKIILLLTIAFSLSYAEVTTGLRLGVGHIEVDNRADTS